MKKAPAVKSVMTPFPYSMAVEASVEAARSMMADHAIHHLPVTERGRLVGVVSERDIELVADPPGGSADPRDVKLGDIAMRDAYVVDLGERLDDVLFHMARTHIDCALIVKEGRLAGIFTVTDACRCYADLLRSMFPTAGDDDVA